MRIRSAEHHAGTAGCRRSPPCDAIPPSNLRRAGRIYCTLRVHLNGLTSIPGTRDFCVATCEGSDRPFNGEYAYARWSVDLSYALIGRGEPLTTYIAGVAVR